MVTCFKVVWRYTGVVLESAEAENYPTQEIRDYEQIKEIIRTN